MLARSITLASIGTTLAATAVLSTARPADGAGRGDGPVILVVSQGLFYDSIVLTDLPNRGPFQLLEEGGPSGLMTDFGPGDRGYVGGRWWVDVNGDGARDDGDNYFLCPLLGPGREEP